MQDMQGNDRLASMGGLVQGVAQAAAARFIESDGDQDRARLYIYSGDRFSGGHIAPRLSDFRMTKHTH